MRRIFAIGKPQDVPDGTTLSPFLNCRDQGSGLPFDLLDGISLAAATLPPGVRSRIHLMPFVTQVTFVRRGALRVRMKGPRDEAPYDLDVGENQAAITEPGAFLQLTNEGHEPCEVLYIVTPAYLFEFSEGQVVFDDSVVLEQDWPEIEADGWVPRGRVPTAEERRGAEGRLREKSAGTVY